MSHSPSAPGPSRRQWLQTAAGLGLAPGWAVGADGEKVLRIAFATAETGFDPTQVNDIYSRGVTSHIFEALYAFDHLARPARIKPLTAAGMPEVSDDFRTWTFRVRPGIFFADDPAFGGRRRELVAEDYVFAIKRYADPKLKSPLWGYTDSYGLLGLAEARQRAIDGKRPFDYDTPIEGLRALDRSTLQIRLRAPRPCAPRRRHAPRRCARCPSGAARRCRAAGRCRRSRWRSPSCAPRRRDP